MKLNNNDAPKLERRFLPAREFRIDTGEGGSSTLAGYAAVFNSNSEDMGFIEQIAPGAFTANLATNPDVRALINHDPNLILGRTKSGTLKLSQDDVGLRFECQLPNTQTARDLSESVARGDLDACSFGMFVQAADWKEQRDGSWMRIITQASLFDVSAVTYPAYTATSVSVRRLFPEGIPAEVREHVPTVGTTETPIVEAPVAEERINENGCDCDCSECQDGHCKLCSNEDCDDGDCDDCAMRSIRGSLLRARIAQAL